jgi:integrase
MTVLAGTSYTEATLEPQYEKGVLALGPRKFRIKYDLPSGDGRKRQRKTETLVGITEKQARAILEQRRVSARNGEYAGVDALTVSAMLDEFMEKKKRSKKEQSTLDRYESLIRLYLRPAFGHLKLKKETQYEKGVLCQAHLTDAYDDWISNGRDGRKASPRTVKHAHDLIRNALNFSLRRGYVPLNVASLVDSDDLPKVIEQKPKALKKGQLRQLLSTAQSPTQRAKKRGTLSSQPWFYPAVAFSANTGARRGEVLALRWANVDLEEKTATIAESLTKIKKTKAPKNDKTRTITLPETLVAILKQHREVQAEEREIMGRAYKDSDLVFALADGSALCPWNFGRAVEDLIKRAKVPRITLHGLRDTHASLLAQAGVPIEVISKRLGHSDIAVTAKRYLDVYQERDAKAAKKFDRLVA